MSKFTKKFPASFFHWFPKQCGSSNFFVQNIVPSVHMHSSGIRGTKIDCKPPGSFGSELQGGNSPTEQLPQVLQKKFVSALNIAQLKLLPHCANKERLPYQGESCLEGPQGPFAFSHMPSCFDTGSFCQSVPMLDFAPAWDVTHADLTVPAQND